LLQCGAQPWGGDLLKRAALGLPFAFIGRHGCRRDRYEPERAPRQSFPAAARLLLALTVGWSLAAILPAPAARALTISPNPFVVPDFDDNEHGRIELVAVVSGVPSGGTVLAGSVDAGDVTLVLRADVTTGDSPLLALGIRPIGSTDAWISPAGVGWVPGSGVNISSGGIFSGAVAFGPVGGSVDAGQSYDLVFLSFDAAPADDGSLQIVGGLLLVPEVVGTATLVPEPKTAALLGLGMMLLARLRRRVTAGTRTVWVPSDGD
jgi:hypothetical protein